ncbi:hypothetical protein DFH05DRAFT_1555474 [Lentinula detonsa]|uniref:Uncharacterized protein n=1 Tax=Lentinula detonsa TaxID=2804962 RepID=A0A9W8P5K7_9AGAR|nr:hypothetical protein DFH05DRAFT_1555474 [Lentinula detonsa]
MHRLNNSSSGKVRTRSKHESSPEIQNIRGKKNDWCILQCIKEGRQKEMKVTSAGRTTYQRALGSFAGPFVTEHVPGRFWVNVYTVAWVIALATLYSIPVYIRILDKVSGARQKIDSSGLWGYGQSEKWPSDGGFRLEGIRMQKEKELSQLIGKLDGNSHAASKTPLSLFRQVRFAFTGRQDSQIKLYGKPVSPVREALRKGRPCFLVHALKEKTLHSNLHSFGYSRYCKPKVVETDYRRPY